MLTPKTVVRSGFGIVFIDQSGITTPFTTPQFPFIQNVQQKTQDSVRPAFALSNGPTVAPIPFTPDAGLGQSVYTVNRTAGSGYVEQWNLAVQRAITNNLSVEVAYVGSHIVHVGIPDSNLNQLTLRNWLKAHPLLRPVPNPYYGELPASSSIGGKTISQAQLLKPYPRFLNIATYRNNSGTSNYNAFEAKVEQRLSHGLTFLFAYTHSKLIDDASSVFSTTVLSSPNSSSLIAADYLPSLARARLLQAATCPTSPHSAASRIFLPAAAIASHRVDSPMLLFGGWAFNTILSAAIGHACNGDAGHKSTMRLRASLCSAPTSSASRLSPPTNEARHTTSTPVPSPPRRNSRSAMRRATRCAAPPIAISTSLSSSASHCHANLQ